jgi:nucleotide-binding universal stress UspA family protein
MIVGVDGSEAGQRALKWAVDEAARRGRAGQQCIVQAMIAWQFDLAEEREGVAVRLPGPRVGAERVIQGAVAHGCGEHLEVTGATQVAHGAPHEIVVRAADHADLLVLGCDGRNRGYFAVVGSVTGGCVRNSTCPVLVIPMAHGAATAAWDQSFDGGQPVEADLS